MKLIANTDATARWFADFDRIFDAFLGTPRGAAADDTEVFETDAAWVLRTDLPGFRKDEVKLSVERGALLLEAATGDQERPFREPVRRNWSLGDQVAADRIDARLEHGVLEITLPKRAPESADANRIEIR